MAHRIGLTSHCGISAHVTHNELNWNGPQFQAAVWWAGGAMNVQAKFKFREKTKEYVDTSDNKHINSERDRRGAYQNNER